MQEFQKNITSRWLSGSLFWFIIIVFLGIAMRFSLGFGISLPTSFEFTRHAHSHTGFWAWAGPAFIGFILAIGIDESRRKPFQETILFWTTQILSFCAIMSFTLRGYSALSIVFSSLMVFLWLGFILYFWKSRIIYGSSAEPLFSVILKISVIMLIISTIPTFFIPLGIVTGIGTQTTKTISIYFFLEMFSEGWLYLMSLSVLLFLGKAFSISGYQKRIFQFSLIILLLFVSFRSSISVLDFRFHFPIYLSSFLWGSFQIGLSFFILKNITNKVHLFISILVLFKGILDICFSFPFSTILLNNKSLVIFYMHLKLLGIVSAVILYLIYSLNFKELKNVIYSKYIVYSGIALTIISLAILVVIGFGLFPIFDLNLGEKLAFFSAIFVWIGAIGFYIQMFYGSR